MLNCLNVLTDLDLKLNLYKIIQPFLTPLIPLFTKEGKKCVQAYSPLFNLKRGLGGVWFCKDLVKSNFRSNRNFLPSFTFWNFPQKENHLKKILKLKAIRMTWGNAKTSIQRADRLPK